MSRTHIFSILSPVGTVFTVLLLLTIAESGYSCDPEVYFLFRAEAGAKLDSFLNRKSDANALARLVLMHNLGFHKDKTMREKAENLLNSHFPVKKRTPLLRAYAGSLQMIKASHRTTSSKIVRTVNPLMKSPLTEAREGVKKIQEALRSDSTNPILHLLLATAAAESAEHLPELFEVARHELTWLEHNAQSSDSVMQFFIGLNWGKYFYKLAKAHRDKNALDHAEEKILQAQNHSCTPVYAVWALEWKNRIADLRKRL